MLQLALVCLLLSLAPIAEAVTMTSVDPVHTPVSLPVTIYGKDVWLAVLGDTQTQTGPRTCGNPNASTIPPVACAANDPNSPTEGAGFVPNLTDCTSQLECNDPNSPFLNRCGAPNPYCLGGSWGEHGLQILDLQVRAMTGRDPRFPVRASAVIQVGDLTNSGRPCASARRDDACTSAVNVTDVCIGSPTSAAAKAGVYNEYTSAINRLLQPLLDAHVPVLVDQGNHDHIGCFETRVKPLVTAQPGFVASAADATHLDTATMYSLKVQTALGPLCFVAYPYSVYSTTAAAGLSLVGCGSGLPTATSSHDGREIADANTPYWNPKPTNAATQIVDRTGHPEVWLSLRGHVLDTGFEFSRLGAGNTNSGGDLFDLRSNWQWSSGRGLGNSQFGGAPWDGAGNPDGTGGEIVWLLISPVRQTVEAITYNPYYGRTGTWDYASTGYKAGVNNLSQSSYISLPLDWCTRFGC